MAGQYQAYPEYKPSGVEWLGDVPKHWDVLTRMKYISSLKGRLGWQGLKADEYIEDGPYVVSSAHFSEHKIQWDACPHVSPERYELDRNIQLAEGDLLLMKDGAAMGKLAYVDKIPDRACLNSHLLLFRPQSSQEKPSYDAKFMYYFMQTDIFQGYIKVNGTGSTFLGISQQAIGNLRLVFPSLVEQTKIVACLDYETAKIDRLMAKQQRLIALLEEKRQAVISHAVTKGRDKSAPLRPSGIDWLGDVPAHWEIQKTKRFFSLQCHAAPRNNDMELLSVYTAIGVRPRKDLEQKGNKATTTDGYWQVEKGDLIVNKLLAWMGAVGHSDYSGVTSPAYDILRKSRPLNTKFYHYLFRSKIAQREFKRWSRGIMEMRLRLYFEELGQIPMPFPPPDEQNVIVAEIENAEISFQNLENKAQSAITLLKERRTALISAAVTGKIDLRDWQLPEGATNISTQDIDQNEEAIA
jgi:type I restriction enzyme S subunit